MKLSYLVVVTTLSMMLISCSADQGKIVISYCKALETLKLDEAASYLSRDANLTLERAGGKSLLAEAGGKFKQRKGIKKIKIIDKKVTGETAIVNLIYNFNDGSTVADSFPLVKENGTWKISK